DQPFWRDYRILEERIRSLHLPPDHFHALLHEGVWGNTHEGVVDLVDESVLLVEAQLSESDHTRPYRAECVIRREERDSSFVIVSRPQQPPPPLLILDYCLVPSGLEVARDDLPRKHIPEPPYKPV